MPAEAAELEQELARLEQADAGPADPRTVETGPQVTNEDVWRVILGQWDDVVSNDLHQFYGIDVGLPETMRRPWWWLRGRLLGLLDVEQSRLARSVANQYRERVEQELRAKKQG